MTLAVAGQVTGEVMTSSPGPIESAASETCSAAVQELTAMACFTPRYSQNLPSSRCTFGPVVIQPERSESSTLVLLRLSQGWPSEGQKFGHRRHAACDGRRLDHLLEPLHRVVK